MKTARSPTFLTILGSAVCLAIAPGVHAQTILESAGAFGALGASTVTNTGSTVIMGSIGVHPGTAITGFSVVDGGPGTFTGSLHQADAVASQAQLDLAAAYDFLASLPMTTDLTGTDLGGLILSPGVYYFSTSAQLTGILTLDAQGEANAQFVFQIGTTLTTATDSQVTIVNMNIDGLVGPDNGVYWLVGTSATIGVNTQFAGNILAMESITLNTGASIDFGRALARNGVVTLDNNRIDASLEHGGFAMDPIPEASTYGVLGACALVLVAGRRRFIRNRNVA